MSDDDLEHVALSGIFMPVSVLPLSVLTLAGTTLSQFREVNGIFYFPELVLGSKSAFTSRNFMFSVHVAIW